MGRPRHVEWLEDYEQCSAWMSQYNLNKLLKKGKGLAKISNFFPDYVAEGILGDLEKIPDKSWNPTEATDDLAYNNISHSFHSVKQARGLDRAIRALTLLQPEELNSFSAARYMKQDHIAPHDDRAFTKVLMEDGTIITTSRRVAVIVYLTKNWKETDGGLLVDLENPSGPKTYVPEFNSAIAFLIPRWHQVTPMTTNRPRYTLFGWFLQPGKLYDLNLGQEGPHDATTAGAPGKQEQAAEVGSAGAKTAAKGSGDGKVKKRKRVENLNVDLETTLPGADAGKASTGGGRVDEKAQEGARHKVKVKKKDKNDKKSKDEGKGAGQSGQGDGGSSAAPGAGAPTEQPVSKPNKKRKAAVEEPQPAAALPPCDSGAEGAAAPAHPVSKNARRRLLRYGGQKPAKKSRMAEPSPGKQPHAQPQAKQGEATHKQPSGAGVSASKASSGAKAGGSSPKTPSDKQGPQQKKRKLHQGSAQRPKGSAEDVGKGRDSSTGQGGGSRSAAGQAGSHQQAGKQVKSEKAPLAQAQQQQQSGAAGSTKAGGAKKRLGKAPAPEDRERRQQRKQRLGKAGKVSTPVTGHKRKPEGAAVVSPPAEKPGGVAQVPKKQKTQHQKERQAGATGGAGVSQRQGKPAAGSAGEGAGAAPAAGASAGEGKDKKGHKRARAASGGRADEDNVWHDLW